MRVFLRLSRPLLLPLLAALLALSSQGCGDPSQGPDGSISRPALDGVDLPRADLTGTEEAVRRQIQQQLESVEALLASPSRPSLELAGALGELGCLYHAYDFLQAAESCYRQAAGLDPQDPRWPYYLGFLFQTQGQFEAAAEALEQVLTHRPNDLPALLRSAEVDLARGRTERAAMRFRRALELEPTLAKAHQELGKLALAAEQADTAIEHLEEALRLQPAASALHYPLGRAYAAAGREQEARRHLEQRGNAEVTFPDPLVAALDARAQGAALRLTRAAVALAEDRPAAALEEYRLALEADPNDAAARLDYGLLLAADGDLEGGEIQVREALARRPGSALAHDALGRILEQRGAVEEALVHFRQASRLDPRLAVAGLHLGSSLLRLERADEAEAEFSRVLDIDPGSAEALLGRARARLDQDLLQPSLNDLRAVLAARPEHGTAHLYLGEALQRLGDDGALEHYRRATELELADAQRAVAHLGAGNLLAARGDWQEAGRHLEAAVKLDAGLHQAHFNLAGIHARGGRFELAAEHYARVLELRPDQLEARLYLAEAQLQLGRYGRAAEQFAHVVAGEPDNEAARLGEAFALLRLQRFAAARDRLEGGLAALPQSGSLAHALARLLAACPQRELRHGARALELAFALQSSQDRLEHAETVAMALAEVGRFADAIAWQRAILERAEVEHRRPPLARLRANLSRYEAGEPCCAGEWWTGDF